jgi:hypothetical protein
VLLAHGGLVMTNPAAARLELSLGMLRTSATRLMIGGETCVGLHTYRPGAGLPLPGKAVVAAAQQAPRAVEDSSFAYILRRPPLSKTYWHHHPAVIRPTQATANWRLRSPFTLWRCYKVTGPGLVRAACSRAQNQRARAAQLSRVNSCLVYVCMSGMLLLYILRAPLPMNDL